MKISTRSRLTALALLACLTNAPATYAASATTSFSVTATVPTICSASATDLGFGSYTGSVIVAASTISVTCTNGTAYHITLDNGLHVSGSQRRMLHGTADFLNYDLYSDSARTTAWQGAVEVTGTGTGAAVVHDVYGRLPAAQALFAGDYTDTITVTVTY